MTGGTLHLDFDLSVEDVEVSLDGGGLSALADGELGTILCVGNGGSNIGPASVLGGGKVAVPGLGVQTGIGRARELRGIGRVAVGVGLRKGSRNDSCQTSSSSKSEGTHGG